MARRQEFRPIVPKSVSDVGTLPGECSVAVAVEPHVIPQQSPTASAAAMRAVMPGPPKCHPRRSAAPALLLLLFSADRPS